MAGKFSKTTTPYGADPSKTPPGLPTKGAGGPEDAGTESDEAPGGRVQGG